MSFGNTPSDGSANGLTDDVGSVFNDLGQSLGAVAQQALNNATGAQPPNSAPPASVGLAAPGASGVTANVQVNSKTLQYILIATAVIVVAVIIFKK